MTLNVDGLFEPRVTFPDIDARIRLASLVGIDEQKNRLAKLVGILAIPKDLRIWVERTYPGFGDLADLILSRPPLVILAGDVGTGKTALAESIGDAIARKHQIGVTLFPMSLSARGQGRVGEMTQLISAAFNHVIEHAKALKNGSGASRGALLLLVDEADALAQSRALAQMHHEDKAGVNAFIRGIDRIARGNHPVVVIMCTNRLSALDPAIRRRAVEILPFFRPDSDQRKQVLFPILTEIGFGDSQIELAVEATGPQRGRDYGFTYSDLIQRLLPTLLLTASQTVQLSQFERWKSRDHDPNRAF